MGGIIQKIKLTNNRQLGNAKEGLVDHLTIKSLEIEALVDKGAAMLCLPLALIHELQLDKIDEKNAQTANGIVKRGIFGSVFLEVFDRKTVLPVMELPDDGTPPLIGYIPLEALDLYPNPKEQKLEGNPKYDGKMVVDLY